MKKYNVQKINSGWFKTGHKPTNGFQAGHKPAKPFIKGQIPWNKKDSVIKECLICTKVFEVRPSRKDTAKFCSKECLGINNRNYKQSKQVKNVISNALKGIVRSKKTKAKFRIAAKNRWDNPEYRNKFIGENHFNWKGDISFEPYSREWTKNFKALIRERDNFTCEICRKQQKEKILCVHHIDYNKKNCNSDNLITLCQECHITTNYNRDEWINYFKLEIKQWQH